MTKRDRTITVDGRPSTVVGAPGYESWIRITPKREVRPFAGLFYYHGLGYGEYFSTDGYAYNCLRSEACVLAAQDGKRMETIDSLEGYKAVYLGD
jgi:hypothetical protein